MRNIKVRARCDSRALRFADARRWRALAPTQDELTMMQKEKSSLVDKEAYVEEKTDVLKHLLEAVRLDSARPPLTPLVPAIVTLTLRRRRRRRT